MRTSLLQSADSEDRIGPFANLQPGVARAALAGAEGRPKFFDYPLPFADRLKSQLLISHCYLPIKKWPAVEGDTEIKSVLRLSHEILFPGRSPDFVLAVVSRREMWRPALASKGRGRTTPVPRAAENGAKGPGGPCGARLRLDQRMQSLHCGLAALDGNK
jgi:hypothetical protein